MSDFKIELEGLDKVLMYLHPEAYEKALASTLNRLGTSMKDKTVKEVNNKYNVKAGRLKANLPEKKATRSNLVWSMEVPRSKKLNLASFKGTRKLKAGVRASTVVGKEFTLKHAFIGKVNGKRVVFERMPGTQMQGRKTEYSHTKGGKRNKREKVRAVQGLSPSQMISERLKDNKLEEVKRKAPDVFKHQFDYYIGKIK